MWAARSMRAQQALGTRPWLQSWGLAAPLHEGGLCAKHFPAAMLTKEELNQAQCLLRSLKTPLKLLLSSFHR